MDPLGIDVLRADLRRLLATLDRPRPAVSEWEERLGRELNRVAAWAPIYLDLADRVQALHRQLEDIHGRERPASWRPRTRPQGHSGVWADHLVHDDHLSGPVRGAPVWGPPGPVGPSVV